MGPLGKVCATAGWENHPLMTNDIRSELMPAQTSGALTFMGPSKCRLGHSGLMPANLITLVHFSTSRAIMLPNSAGELPDVT